MRIGTWGRLPTCPEHTRRVGLVCAGLLVVGGLLWGSGCSLKRLVEARNAAAAPVAEPPKPSRIEHLDQDRFDREVLKSPTPVVVDFYAEWCGPCKRLAPLLEELAGENPAVRFVKIDIDRCPDLASRYGVRTIPNVIVFKNGEPAGRSVGLTTKEHLKSLLASN